jgi:hypothetical protein
MLAQLSPSAKRAITVTADAKTKTYGDNEPALTYTVTSRLTGRVRHAGWKPWA